MGYWLVDHPVAMFAQNMVSMNTTYAKIEWVQGWGEMMTCKALKSEGEKKRTSSLAEPCLPGYFLGREGRFIGLPVIESATFLFFCGTPHVQSTSLPNSGNRI